MILLDNLDNVKFEDKAENNNTSLFESIEDETENKENKNKRNRKRKRKKDKAKSYSELIGEYVDNDSADINKNTDINNADFENEDIGSLENELSNNRTTCPKVDTERKRIRVNENAKSNRYADTLKTSAVIIKSKESIQPNTQDVYNPDTKVDFQNLNNSETELFKQSYEKFVTEQTSSISDEVSTQSCIQNGYSSDTKHIRNGYSSGTHTDFHNFEIDGTTDFDDVQDIPLKDNEISPKRFLRSKNNDSSSQTGTNTAYSQFTLSYENDELADFEKSKESEFGSEKESKFSYGLDKEVSVHFDENIVEESVLNKSDNSSSKRNYKWQNKEDLEFQETELENNIGSSMFESGADKGNIESKETSHRVADRKKKAFSDELLNKSSENGSSSYSYDNRFAAFTEEKSSYSDFSKSAENNGSLFVNKVDNTNENLIDRLNEDNDFESGYITKHNELSEHHTKIKANGNYKSSSSTANSDFEKSIASNSTVFASGELDEKVNFDIKSDDVNGLIDNLLDSHTKNKQLLSKELNDKQGEFFENSYNDAEFKKLNIPTDYSESIDAKSNVFTDKLAAEENRILFTENEKSGEQGKIFDSEIDENIYKTIDDENIPDVLRTDNYNSQFQSENSIPNENSTAKSEKSADIKSLKKKKSTDYNNTFSNIFVYKKGRPRLKDSAIVKNFRKANRIYAKAKKIAKVVDVDSKNTITEDAKNIAVGAALGAGEKALKDMAFNSVKVDKFCSDKKKNNLSSDKYSNNSALKEISKKFARQQQYKNVMEIQQLYKQAAVKAAKTKAASAAGKGLLAFFSVPVVPIITFILVVALVSMFIWGTVLIVLGIADGLVSTTYMTTNSEITSSTAYYTKLESELLARVNETIEELNDNNKIDKVETEFDPIEHNPEQLEAYLSAVYPGYDFNGGFVNWVLHKLVGYPYYGFGGIKNVENDIFDYQYSTEVTYRTEKKGFYVIKIATVHLYNKGFDNTIEYFLQNLPEEYYEEDEKDLIYDHYKDLREYRGNHGFWLGTPVDYDWRNYVVGLYGYETTNGGITSVSSIGTVQSKSAVTETTDEDISHYDQKLLGNFTTTGYCPCVICCGKYSPEVTGKPSTTASGTFPVQGRTIAVDPKVIPLGAKVLINGHIYTAEDTGGAIKGNRIDVYYNNHQDALVHGKQTGVTVYLLTLKTGEEEPAASSSVSSSDNKLADIALEELEEGVSGTPNKYTEWYGEIRGTTSYNWCAAFVSYCVDKAGMSSIVPKTAAVSDLMDNAQKSGIWQSKDSYKPVAGDIMIQKENGTSHTGIVVESTDTYFIAVEGNSGSNSLSSSKVSKYKYFYDDENAVTGFIQTGSTAENFGGSMYYRFNNFAKGTDIKNHKGIDIAGTSSTNVLSVIDGTVKRKTSDSLVIENDMFEVTYESIKDISSEIGRGSEVTLGQVVAKMDDAESRDVPIVHISVIQKDGNEEMNPFIYCDIGTGSAPYVNLSSSLVNVGIGGGTVSALFGDIHAPYIDEFANRAVVTSSFFDTYHTSFHRAIDLAVTYGSNVGIAAAWDGKVVMVGSGNGNGLTGYGYVVVLEHNIDGVMVYTKYNHMKMNSSTLNVGDVVSAGQQIGIQGSTGFASGEHLDFQMGICTSGYNWSEFSNHLINPIAIYQGWSQSLQTISVWNSSGGCVRKGDDYNQTRKVNNMSGKHIF